MVIREFRHTDLDALINIAKVSFAEEYTASGQSPESFTHQVRTAARGRMIPLRLLSSLAGIQWKLFVAEVDGLVVGCGSYMGRETMELANLMVHPQYRRRGIGQAMLAKRLQHLREKGYPYAKTTVLATNAASLGNLRKQGFEVFDRFTVLEVPLPLPHQATDLPDDIISRPVRPSDVTAFQELEQQISNPVWLQIQGSATLNYFPSLGERLMQKFGNAQGWVRVFVQDENVIGFLSATTAGNQTKGTVFRPVIAQEHVEYLPHMLNEAAVWLRQLGKETIRIGVPDKREQLMQELMNRGWVKTVSWVQLVKWLEK